MPEITGNAVCAVLLYGYLKIILTVKLDVYFFFKGGLFFSQTFLSATLLCSLS